MTSINQLSAIDTLTAGDLLAVWASGNGDTRKAALSVLTTYLQSTLALPGALTTQYAAPSATGFSVTVAAGNTWLILTPTAGFAAGTIVLPTSADDRAEVNVNCTQSVGTLTVSAGGTTVTGAPTALSANGFFTMRFDDVANVWYRVA